MRDRGCSLQNKYIENLYAREDELLQNINSKLMLMNREIQITAIEGKVLQVLLTSINAKSVVEVGTLLGYSTIWIARAASVSRVDTIEANTSNFTYAKENFVKCDVSDKIFAHHGKALDVLVNMNGPVDAIFIDADKRNYPRYLEWAAVNVRKGGLIIADNSLQQGKVYDLSAKTPQVQGIREFNEALSDKSKYCSIIMPMFDGLSIAVKLT